MSEKTELIKERDRLFIRSQHLAQDKENLEKENTELRDFKEFTNMMIRRNLNHSASSYEVIMAIDEKLTGKE